MSSLSERIAANCKHERTERFNRDYIKCRDCNTLIAIKRTFIAKELVR